MREFENKARKFVTKTVQFIFVMSLAACNTKPVPPALNPDGSVRVTSVPQGSTDPQNDSFSGINQKTEQNPIASHDPKASDPNYIYYPPMNTYYKIVSDPYSSIGSNNRCVEIGAGQTIWGAASVLSGDPAVFSDPVAINVTVYDSTSEHNVIGSFTTSQDDTGLKQIDETRILSGSKACKKGEIVNQIPVPLP